MPGEALPSVLFRLRSLNSVWTSLGLPSWDTHQDALGEDLYRLTLTSVLPKVRGYTVLGTVSNATGFTPVPGASESLSEEVPDDVVCAECGTRRAKQHFVLRNDEGVTLVATKCLPVFMGRLPHQGFDASLSKPQNILDNPATLLSTTVARVQASSHLDTNAVIATAMWLTEEHGYVNRTRADRLGMRSTAEEIESVLTHFDEEGRLVLPDQVTSKLLPAAVMRQWALDDADASSDYMLRLKEAVARPQTTRHAFGIIAALPAAYHRASRIEEAVAVGDPIPGQDYADSHLGEPGQRVTLANAILEECRLLASGSTILILRSQEGQRIVWFSTTPPRNGYPETGSHVSIMGTVKAHREFRGVKETTLTRCRFLA